MSKKIIPIVTLLGASALIVGATIQPTKIKKENFLQQINSFKNEVSKYDSVNKTNLTSTVLNKYSLSLNENLDDITNSNIMEISETNTSTEQEQINDVITNEEPETKVEIKENAEQISTLYSLSNDIEESCDEFCELKKDIYNAIVETQNLITKLQQKEIELSKEQRLFISEQAQQLKNLGRQLSNITTELSFNVSEISQIMLTNGENIDNLSLKYLVVLDNLVNGNEMLQSGLSSLNLINQMFNMNSNTIPPNNKGRILYGFQHNNNPPIINNYYIDENGNMVEVEDQNMNTSSENLEKEIEKKTNIDTYKNTNLTTNLDTYNNNNLPHNIDSFFNTALLDNEFMYGNGNYGYGLGGMNGVYNNNPYSQQYNNHLTGGVTNNDYPQHNADNLNSNENKKEQKQFKLKKNIDTFKDENEPDIKTKLGNIKNSITGFFKKFKISALDDKIDNPVYRFNPNDDLEEKF